MTRTSYGASSTVALKSIPQPLSGNKAHVWSNWLYSSPSNTWPVAFSTSVSTDYGFDMEAYEVQMKQLGTWWGWPALRFPGQYYDAETELHENWNRYYDPQVGQYLSPEPLLQAPTFVKEEALDGFSVPTYGYARNNPLRFTDPDGLRTPKIPGGKAGQLCTPATCGKQASVQCGYLPEDSAAKPLNAPPPGQCVDADAAYTSSGIVKIPDTCRCDIVCAPGGGYGGLACSCWRFPKRETQYIPADVRVANGWPTNPWLSYSGTK
ncbi:MAG: RHS repeat-associated core domain-containing protein [Archangium sp.]|nr:RHS repeat-associated core domain-containing protein [Archangium sp.]